MPRWLMQLRMDTGAIEEVLDEDTHWVVNFKASGLFARIKWIACEDSERWAIWEPI